MGDGARDLEAELGAPPPPGIVATLSDEELGRLAGTIGTTRQEEAAALAASGEAGLRFVPSLLRGPVKRIVGLR